jgi:hypothetical protein
LVGARRFEGGAYPKAIRGFLRTLLLLTFTFALRGESATLSRTHVERQGYDCPGKHLGAEECGKWCGSLDFNRTFDSRRRGWIPSMRRHPPRRIPIRMESLEASLYRIRWSPCDENCESLFLTRYLRSALHRGGSDNTRCSFHRLHGGGTVIRGRLENLYSMV